MVDTQLVGALFSLGIAKDFIVASAAIAHHNDRVRHQNRFAGCLGNLTKNRESRIENRESNKDGMLSLMAIVGRPKRTTLPSVSMSITKDPLR